MRNLLIVLAASFPLVACANGDIKDLTIHLNERGCTTKGKVTGSASMTGSVLTGDLAWRCGGPGAQDPSLNDETF